MADINTSRCRDVRDHNAARAGESENGREQPFKLGDIVNVVDDDEQPLGPEGVDRTMWLRSKGQLDIWPPVIDEHFVLMQSSCSC